MTSCASERETSPAQRRPFAAPDGHAAAHLLGPGQPVVGRHDGLEGGVDLGRDGCVLRHRRVDVHHQLLGGRQHLPAGAVHGVKDMHACAVEVEKLGGVTQRIAFRGRPVMRRL